MKWKLSVLWMTVAEQIELHRLRTSGKVSAFRIRICAGEPEGGCSEEVPRIDDEDGQPLKLFCSKRCYDSKHLDEDDDDDEYEDEDEGE